MTEDYFDRLAKAKKKDPTSEKTDMRNTSFPTSNSTMTTMNIFS